MTGAPIFISFVLLDALVIWLLIASGGKKWALKLTAIVITLLFNFAVWSALGTFRGYPTQDSIPKQAFFLTALIDQPSDAANDTGHIDLWLIPLRPGKSLIGYNPSLYEPRAFREPYSRALEKAVIHAQNLQKKNGGQPVVLANTGKVKKSRAHGTSPGRKIDISQFRSYNLPKQTPLSKRGH